MPSAAVRALSERQKRKFEEVDARLVARHRDQNRGLWDFGTDLRTLSREQLWLSGGFPSFNEYVEARFDMSPAQARGLRRAARFPRAALDRYGWAKLDLVARLWLVLPGDEQFAQIDSYAFRIPTESGVVTRTLAQMSKRDLLAAMDLASDDTETARVPVALGRFVAALEAQLVGLAGVRVRSSGSATSPRFAVLGVPLNEAATLRDALAHSLRSGSGVPAVPDSSGRRVVATTPGRRPLVVRPMTRRRG